MIRHLLAGLALVWLSPTFVSAADADDTATVLAKYKPATDKGLKWLAEQQQKDGHWEGNGGGRTVEMTALAGLALLAEGGTAKDGAYAEQLRKAVEWVTG